MKRLCQVGALLIAILAIGCAPTAPTTDHPTIAFRYSHFDPGTVWVPVRVPVTFVLKNDDPIGHEWIVGSPEIHAVHRVGTEAVHDSRPDEVSVAPYTSRTTTLTFDKAGTYEFICHLPGHEEYGMKGTVVVGQTSRA